MLHTTAHHHTTINPATDFAFNVLPPNKSESERELRRLIDECVEEKEQVEAGKEIEKYFFGQGKGITFIIFFG